jgi:arsenite methyltransferase
MNKSDEIRKQVSADYAAAVNNAVKGGDVGCCGGTMVSDESLTSGGCCAPSAVPEGVAAKLAGYSPEELSALPAEAVVSSFGCGNPVALSGISPGQTVLDLGSGAGIDLLLAAKIVGPEGRALGVDMTDDMIEHARRNAAAAGLDNVEVRKGIIEEIPVEDGTVDWVISNCVINLSPEKDRVFKEIARVLRPGGQMLVSDIVAEDLPDWVLKSAGMYSSCLAGAIDEASYLGGLRAAGLEDVEVRERLVYDATQLAAFVTSEGVGELSSCCGGEQVQGIVKEIASGLTGKIWSAKVYARKP